MFGVLSCVRETDYFNNSGAGVSPTGISVKGTPATMHEQQVMLTRIRSLNRVNPCHIILHVTEVCRGHVQIANRLVGINKTIPHSFYLL